LLDGLIHSGIIYPIGAKEARIAEFKTALREAKEMAENIAAGTKDYETMDGFLKKVRESLFTKCVSSSKTTPLF
jgi:hypothetical protein